MSQFAVMDQLPRHRPQPLAIGTDFFTRGSTVWSRPGRAVAEDGWSKNPVGLDGGARGRVLRKWVQGNVLAAGATQGREAEAGRLNCRDAVQSVVQVVFCVSFLQVEGGSVNKQCMVHDGWKADIFISRMKYIELTILVAQSGSR